MVKVGKYETVAEYIQSYRAQDWLRLLVIVGGYILLRPILIRFGARIQEKQLEKEDTKVSEHGAKQEKKQEKKSRDDLQWGAGARVRQRKARDRQFQDGEESDSDELEDLFE